ncbi:hypothetical protein [Streptomyces sp. C]|uniref:hypothetical protein n=1 Tax=Streptomyces sp. C TaxID=253839 RepID=UPI0013EE09E4|nr:hypothetical protein [Streptomyces sp. C]
MEDSDKAYFARAIASEESVYLDTIQRAAQRDTLSRRPSRPRRATGAPADKT